MESIKEKLALLELNEKERKIALEKFIVSLSLASLPEMKEIVDFLNSKNIHLNKAREIKVLCNDFNEIVKNFNIIDSINETNLYREDPVRLNSNALDIFKKIKYCTQAGISYCVDNHYLALLFDEGEWQKVAHQPSESLSEPKTPASLQEEMITVPPVMDSTPEVASTKVSEPDLTSQSEPSDSLDTYNFDKIREELQNYKNELAGELNFDTEADEISFDDLNIGGR